MVEVKQCPVSSNFVSEMEAEIRSCVQEKKRKRGDSLPVYPLQAMSMSGGKQEVPLEREMHEELHDSWDAFHASHKPSLKLAGEPLRECIAEWQVGISPP